MKYYSPLTKYNGFTLIEMSIVLVIIGLIVGGILTGKSLIRSADLNQMVVELKGYEIAVTQFDDKYGHLPGDIPNAMSFWPSCIAVDPGHASNTCNGNGNRMIEVPNREILRAWQHLSFAGLVPGQYTGLEFSGTGAWERGVNVVAGGIKNTVIFVGHWHPVGAQYSFDRTHNYISVGKLVPNIMGGGVSAGGAFLTPEEAYIIDTKFDDGVADSGSLHTFFGTNDSGSCLKNVSGSLPYITAGEYDLLDKTVSCRIHWVMRHW